MKMSFYCMYKNGRKFREYYFYYTNRRIESKNNFETYWNYVLYTKKCFEFFIYIIFKILL